ncbi:MAG: Holliday junction branch migration protein RuvA [Erysipelotrichia bacterium]|nr:Holliday junction branch migration protein RuvA [Erysipelotrichia bacterium]
MIRFIRGTVYSFTTDTVIIDNNGIGYLIYFSHPEKLTLGEEIMIFIYQHFRDDGTVLYGFLSTEELNLFEKLITVKGLGPKTAMTILSKGTYDYLINAIENGDVNYLKRIPTVGSKTAAQIILDLKGKLIASDNNNNVKENILLKEAIEGLKSLGYKNFEINQISNELTKMNLQSVDEYLKEGLKLLMKYKGV